MDRALEEPDLAEIQEVLAEFERDGVRFHALRTRQAGARRFVSLHVLVPGAWTVQQGHDLVERVEAQLCERLPGASVFTHLEPAEDPRSFADTTLDRPR
jgi:divalent metal cation (Fe/Co/Zn/Cd) transporter